MTVGLGLLRLPSAAFWSLTPLELAAALESFQTAAPPTARTSLNELMTRFPDQTRLNGD